MKTLTAKKIVAIFTAVSLTFLQAVPAGFAGVDTNTPVIPIDERSVSAEDQPPVNALTPPADQTVPEIPSGAESLSQPGALQPLDTQEPQDGPTPAIVTPFELAADTDGDNTNDLTN